ncbi:MAG: septum formation protein Maf [Flavobacteriales bacterium]|nr:septum formation protein Maf [Flavobacteriales bacterium]
MEKLNTNNNIILGSKSPRRIELMKMMGIPFKVLKLNTNEDYPKSLSPIEVAIYLSKKKANNYLIKSKEILICADTVVYSGKNLLEKPNSINEAKKMLELISNSRHFVVTGVTIKTKNKMTSFYDRSIVYFKKLTKKEINYYIKNYNPFDKAGGYGIQEWIGLIGINKISGSFYNVMGLPTHRIYEKLNKINVFKN